MHNSAIKRFLAMSNASLKAHKVTAGEELDMHATHMEDQLEALQQLGSCVNATTPSGALFQICMAVSDAFDLESLAQGKDALIHRRLTRNLYSLLGYIESLAGFTANHMDFDYYMCRTGNPFKEHPEFQKYSQEIEGKTDAA